MPIFSHLYPAVAVEKPVAVPITPVTTKVITPDLVSLMLCTIDRYDLTVKCVGGAIENACYPNYELLCVDNGSTDRRVVDYIQSLNPAFHQINTENLGIAKMLNVMLKQAKGEYLCVIDNDIKLPVSWLYLMVEWNRMVALPGISGIHCVESLPDAVDNNGKWIHPVQMVYGTKFWNRRVFESIGYFNEAYGLYGREDGDYGVRAAFSGFTNYYLHGLKAEHLGDDLSENTPYRKMKWDALRASDAVYAEQMSKYVNGLELYYAP